MLSGVCLQAIYVAMRSLMKQGSCHIQVFVAYMHSANYRAAAMHRQAIGRLHRRLR